MGLNAIAAEKALSPVSTSEATRPYVINCSLNLLALTSSPLDNTPMPITQTQVISGADLRQKIMHFAKKLQNKGLWFYDSRIYGLENWVWSFCQKNHFKRRHTSTFIHDCVENYASWSDSSKGFFVNLDWNCIKCYFHKTLRHICPFPQFLPPRW